MSEKWRNVAVDAKATIREVLELIGKTSTRIALVTDKEDHLLGTVTDGDIRRALLDSIALNAEITDIMNESPITADFKMSRESIISLMLSKDILAIPIISNKKVAGIESLGHSIKKSTFDNVVFIMAGGYGKRLRPLTHHTPKPLLNVGSKPILELIIERLASAGFYRFYISTHYQEEKFQEHLGDGGKWNIEINYIREEEPLGTAGALGLLPHDEINEPVLLMNGDLLTNLDFHSLIRFHQANEAIATVCVHEYENTIPYGVIEFIGDRIKSIEEKPTYRHFINAGIYLLSPKLIKTISNNTAIHITTLIEEQIQKGLEVKVFPLYEYWLDIGQLEDYDRAQRDIKKM